MRVAAMLLVTAALVVPSGCGGDGSERELTGVVVEIQSAGLGSVEGFTLKVGDERVEIHVDPDRDYGFPLDHLAEHRVTAEPVRVEAVERDGRLIAVTIEDAGP